jgi:hypothetical protein
MKKVQAHQIPKYSQQYSRHASGDAQTANWFPRLQIDEMSTSAMVEEQSH